MKNIVLGICAHVDAGKTTLTEALLYTSGAIDKLGRVDKKDCFLDTHEIERERGITVFSKQAVFDYLDTHVTVIDTPGHVDFSCEAERALSIQDYAVLVISAQDGVSAHTKTLWRLLRKREIPTFIFVNKMDIADRQRADILAELRTMLGIGCVDFSREHSSAFYEDVAAVDEMMIGEFLDTDSLGHESICRAVSDCKLYPCFFGSALKLKGTEELLSAIAKYTVMPKYHKTIFGARVYKTQKNALGQRLSFAKITGGSLRPKDTVQIRNQDGTVSVEKVEELRIYSADKSKPVKEALPGTVCAIIGPTKTKAGTGLGFESDDTCVIAPILTYRLILPSGQNPYEAYLKLADIADEDPSLSMHFDSDTSEIKVSLMGDIQLEVLTRIIKDRCSLDVSFDEGKILYKETISDEVIGSAHFEPLRHYAEVHLRIEPLPEGSGIIAMTECDRDSLSLSWQRLVLTHIEERVHRGVLTGSPLTDVKITLIAGRAHLKHTEGGDFRQATYRAVRQGLCKASSVLLEPTFDFRIEMPEGNLGRFINDLTNMHGCIIETQIKDGIATVEGNCPAATMRSYPKELRAYTRGEGQIALSAGGYVPCHNSEEVIRSFGYDKDADKYNRQDSVFCKAGAGYVVPWYEADSLMHIKLKGDNDNAPPTEHENVTRPKSYRTGVEEDKELMRIFEATYGKVKQRSIAERVENRAQNYNEQKKPPKRNVIKTEEYVYLDGYNVIFAWDELKVLADAEISLARDTLIRMMCDYSSVARCRVVIVFDAYKRKDNPGSTERFGNVSVVYTKEAETADRYIERATHNMPEEHRARVVTGDLAEQYIILGNGALRASVREFRLEYLAAKKDIEESTSYIK